MDNRKYPKAGKLDQQVRALAVQALGPDFKTLVHM